MLRPSLGSAQTVMADVIAQSESLNGHRAAPDDVAAIVVKRCR